MILFIISYVADNYNEEEEKNLNEISQTYELPDGNILYIWYLNERSHPF